MSFVPLPTDDTSGAVTVIPFMHHEVHEGDAFRYFDAITLGSAATQDYLITTPNTTDWAHFTFQVDGLFTTTVTFFEATDRNGTTLQTPRNANRNSATANSTTIRKGTSGGTTDGVQLYVHSGGSSTGPTRTGATAGDFDNEWILKQNTKYILRITSGAASNLINVAMHWYEHTNGE